MSTNCPPVSNIPSMSRRFRPLSMTWVRPSVLGLPGRCGRSRKPSLKAGIDLLQLFLGDLLDLLDLCRFERSGAADDREIDHSELAHRLDRVVREATLAADRP